MWRPERFISKKGARLITSFYMTPPMASLFQTSTTAADQPITNQLQPRRCFWLRCRRWPTSRSMRPSCSQGRQSRDEAIPKLSLLSWVVIIPLVHKTTHSLILFDFFTTEALFSMQFRSIFWKKVTHTRLRRGLVHIRHRNCTFFPLPHNIHLHPSLIRNCLSLIKVFKAMRTRFYRWFLDTENDGSGLQWDFISRCWISYTESAEFP